jgi:hypothetical protein
MITKPNRKKYYPSLEPKSNEVLEAKEPSSPRVSSVPDANELAELGGDVCTLEDSGFTIPYCTYYFDAAFKKELILEFDQCNSMGDLGRVIKSLRIETESLYQRQNELYEKIEAANEPPKNQDKYDKYVTNQVKNIQSYIALAQRRLTVIEFSYYYLSDLDSRLDVETATKHYLQDTLVHLCGCVRKLDALTRINSHREVIQTQRTLFSVIESLRNSRLLSEKINDSCLHRIEMLLALSDSYSGGYLHSESFNIIYAQQIALEYFESLSQAFDEYKELFPPYATNCSYVYAYFMLARVFSHQEFTVAIQYLENSSEHIESALACVFDHENTCLTEAPYIDLNTGKIVNAPEVDPIQELRLRIVALEMRLVAANIFVEKFLKEVSDGRLFLRLHIIKQSLAKLETVLQTKTQALNLREKETVAEKKVATVKKTRPKISQHSTFEAKPSNLPVLTPIQSAPKIIDAPRITDRVPCEQQELDKKLKTDAYNKRLSFLASPLDSSSSSARTTTSEGDMEFSFMLFGKQVRAKLDSKACIDAMGEQTFKEFSKKLNDIVMRGKVRGDHGQGFKIVSKAERKELKLPKDTLWLKIKPLGEFNNIRIYGDVTYARKQKVIFNLVEMEGDVHRHTKGLA